MSLLWISLVLAVLLGAFITLLWVIGVFDLQKKATARNAQVYAAVLGLVGGFFATALTFVAALLKHSIDVRTLGQARETEQRLRLETSIRAVELLTENGREASPSRQAGALFVLGSLDQLDFALALLAEIWPKRDISPMAAVWVVNRALMSQDEQTQIDGALQLVSNADTLKDTSALSCYEWPPYLSRWTNDIAVIARENLLDALLKVLASKPRWDPDCVNTFLLDFDQIRRIDDAPHIRDGAVLAMNLLLGMDQYAHDFNLLAPHGKVSVAELQAQVSAQASSIEGPAGSFLVQSVDALRTAWSELGIVAPAPGRPTPGTAPENH